MSKKERFYGKSLLLLPVVLVVVALFIYSSYSFYYEYQHWKSAANIILFSVLMALEFFWIAWFAARSNIKKPAGVKKAVLLSLAALAADQGLLWGITSLINNVIYHGNEREFSIKVAYAFIFILMAVILVILFKNLADRSGKVFSVIYRVFAGVLAVVMLGGSVKMTYKYYTYGIFYPVYRLFTDIGGVDCSNADYRYDFAYSSEKLLQTDGLGADSMFSISLAKNEYEGLQFIIASTKSDGEVKISVSDFEDGKGNKIKASVYLENYIDVWTYGSAFSNAYPDALIPYDGASVKLEKNYSKAFYIEIKSGADTAAGDYKANVRTFDESGSVIGEAVIKAHIWNFEVPEKPSMDTAMGLASSNFWKLNGFDASGYGWNGTGGTDITDEQRALYIKYYEYLLEHRISPYVLPYDILDGRADAYMSDPRVTSFCVPYPDDDNKLIAYYKKVSSNPVWAAKAYFYPIDEPGSEEAYANYTNMTERLARLCPGYNMVTPFNTDKVKIGGTDYSSVELQKGKSSILCGISDVYDNKGIQNEISAAVKDGSRSWWYVCCGPTGDYCNFFIRYQGLKQRILFWQQKSLNVTGLLYWDTVYWDNTDPWDSSKTWSSYDCCGDGCQLYPGKEVGVDGPVGTLRLANITDGLEDYEYFTLAQKLMGREWLDGQIAKVTSGLTEYTDSPELLESVRCAIGDAIEANIAK